ncbi:Down syndrome cell adhesion molecule 4 isoform X2 [Rhodnius prolixus]|uniref:Down syndrome cell adhesion molecule 4 isoform X2 n=1 Tax=Rhodnius prolixus TaxID=13249 RepID=UPI003D1899E9
MRNSQKISNFYHTQQNSTSQGKAGDARQGKLARRHAYMLISLLFNQSVFAHSDLQGPHFNIEPPFKVDFSNNTGTRVDCSVHSNPPSKIEWIQGDGMVITPVAGLREVMINGSLYFPPFPGDLYNQDVHRTVYRCRASNTVGQIISRDVNIRAVIKQKYEVQVYDEYVISGNTAVMRCQVPSYAAEFTIVTSWIQEDVISIYPNSDTGGKYAVMSNGDLYVYKTNPSDGYKSYGCRTVHTLTGEVQTSSYSGRIIVSEPKGTVQPRIRVEKHSRKKVKFGEDITLPCLAQGYPLPTYRWFKEESEKLSPVLNSDRIRLDEAGLLYISNARQEDHGKYICRINNSVGEEAAQVSLAVIAPLTAAVIPDNLLGEIGSTASLSCRTGGFPVNRVTWYRDGQPLLTDSHLRISTNPDRVTIIRLAKGDNGMYQCFVHNEWDMAQAIAELHLAGGGIADVSPELIYSFSEQTLQPGPPLSLKCVATGSPPPVFTWTLDGFRIPESTRLLMGQYVTVEDDVVSHVNISDVQEQDGGEYACTANNSVAQITHSARINVYGLPYIRVMPKVSTVAGSDLVIKCPVAGYPIESITWERDGVQLPVNRRQKVYSNGTLVIEQAQPSADVGTYTCQAQNRQKHTARRDVEVHVLLPPKILPMHAMTNLLREGMRAAMTCQVLEGDLPLTFKWQRNGKDDLGPGAVVRRLDEYSTSLFIEKIAAYHSANYSCIVTNIAGSETFTVPLTVNVPPRWVIEPMDMNVVLGYDIMLECQADGYPQPTIIWRKAVGDPHGEYKDFLYEPNISFYRNGSLKFSRISKESEGHYLCEAKNGISNGVSKVIHLKVNSPAYFVQKSKQLYIQKGEQAHVQCTAIGDTPISVMWKVGQQKIGEDFDPRFAVREQLLDEGMVSELGISKVTRHDSGILSCYAVNSFGSDEMKIHLIVQEIPELPKNIRVIDQQSRSLQLSWTQPYTGNSPITSYIIQYKLVSEPWHVTPAKVVVPGIQTVATVASLNPATSYHLRILAENKLGISEPSEVIQVTTQEEAPSGKPCNIKIEAKSPTELFLRWEAPDKETWHGNLLGYSVAYAEVSSSSNFVTDTQILVTQQPSVFPEVRTRTVEAGPQYSGQLAIEGLAPFTSYRVTISALNSRGAGPASEPILAKTNEGVPTMPPEKVSCSTLSSVSLEIFWDPPPTEGRNGNIQGFKISYFPDEEWFIEKPEIESKKSTTTRTTLTDLMKFTNYSISVLAYTQAGDGVTSQPVYCRTAEDVPSAPADIKAVMSSPNKILVSWLPPAENNGQLIGYTFYMGIIENGKEGGTHKHELNPSIESHEIAKVQDGITYQFWVTASTRMGEGDSTRVVTLTPLSTIGAKIVSFSREIVTPWKQNLTLLCRYVGIPVPKLDWKVGGNTLSATNNRYLVKKDGSLLIRDVQYADRGNYSCSVGNRHGEDSIYYLLKVRVPPDPPVLTIISSEADSIHVKWTTSTNNGIPILGFVINYKRDHGDWEEMQIGARESSLTLLHLWCGTRYQLYMTAYNKIGTGLPCDIVNAYTKGTPPVKPSSSQLLTVNSTAITVWLDSWGDGGCSILYFIIEFKQSIRSDWLLLSNHILPTERIQTIGDLIPGTFYHIRVIAHNNAGSNVGLYNITTLAPDGSLVYPTILSSSDSSINSYISMKVVWCVTFGMLAISSFIMGCVYVRKRKESMNCGMGESPSVAQLQNQQNRDQQYAVHFTQQTNLPTNLDSTAFKTNTPEYIEDVCPYATFQLAKPPYTESTFSGNVYSGPYHSVRGSFVYHDLPSNAETYKSRHIKEPEYTKVRRKPTVRLRDPHSAESQESDNLGSTDSEVKKILTLHLPISEYDTHGSDSDIDAQNAASTQEIVQPFRHSRVNRSTSIFLQDLNTTGEGSSSSSERSPTSTRKTCPHSRKLKAKLNSSTSNNKKSLINKSTCSVYDNQSEETSFCDRIYTPCSSRYSEPRCHSREHVLNEIECDINKHGGGVRRLSKSSVTGPYRLSRESTFQIDV